MRTRSRRIGRSAAAALAVLLAAGCGGPDEAAPANESNSQSSPDADGAQTPTGAVQSSAAQSSQESASAAGRPENDEDNDENDDAPASAARTAPHGAMEMDAQIARLADLTPADADALVPSGVDPIAWADLYVPDDNEMTAERIALGRKLYFDVRLSRDGTVSCATCHDVSRGFTDQRMVSEGIGDQLGRRNAPTTMNAAFFQTQFLDGRSALLEDQALLPITNPIEMGHASIDDALAAIADDADYQEMFEAAYGEGPSEETLGKAIAAFERTLIFLDAPFDRFVAGEEDAISEQARRGFVLFNGKARCASCHMMNDTNPLGTDNRFHNIGIAARVDDFEEMAAEALAALAEAGDDVEVIDRLALETDLSDLGRFIVTKDRSDIGAFKTSQLRNIGVTGPYMHDGSLATLWDVMDHYNKGGEANPFLDGGMEPLALTESEISDLVAFMFSLTDDRLADENAAALENQTAAARKNRPFRDTALANREVFPFEARVMGTEENSGGGQ